MKTIVIETALVICDACSYDYTTSTAQGGLIFQSYAVCPTCAPRWEERLRGKRFPSAALAPRRCPPGQTFADFVRGVR